MKKNKQAKGTKKIIHATKSKVSQQTSQVKSQQTETINQKLEALLNGNTKPNNAIQIQLLSMLREYHPQINLLKQKIVGITENLNILNTQLFRLTGAYDYTMDKFKTLVEQEYSFTKTKKE
jgi:hypothetical protein